GWRAAGADRRGGGDARGVAAKPRLPGLRADLMTVHIAPADLRGLRARKIGALPGGGLVWSATVAVTLVLVIASAGLHDGRVILATGACALFGIVFAVRPALGVAAIVVVRPSLDLWADRPLASIGSIQLN